MPTAVARRVLLAGLVALLVGAGVAVALVRGGSGGERSGATVQGALAVSSDTPAARSVTRSGRSSAASPTAAPAGAAASSVGGGVGAVVPPAGGARAQSTSLIATAASAPGGSPKAAAEVLAPHQGAVGGPWNEGSRPIELPALVVAAPDATAKGALDAIVHGGFPMTQRSGADATKDLAALLDPRLIVSVARYEPTSAAKLGYPILIEFRDEQSAIEQAKILSDTRHSHLSGETVLVRAGRLVAGYIPAPGQPDRAAQFYAAMATLAP